MNITLDTLKPGQIGVVKDLTGQEGLIQRLSEMGITPGVECKVVRYAPFGDPIEIAIGDYHLSLRRREAGAVNVSITNQEIIVATAPKTKNTFALIGNPNTGKTTLFNALTGLNHKVGNYPGVTVEYKSGILNFTDGTAATIIDLPGTYSLAARSPDEMVAVDVLLGQQPGAPEVDGVLVIADASNLRRNMYLVSQLIEFGMPTCLVLNMEDVAARQGVQIDIELLQKKLGIPVVISCAKRGQGILKIKEAIHQLPEKKLFACSAPTFPQDFQKALSKLEATLESAKVKIGRNINPVEALRILVDSDGTASNRLLTKVPELSIPLSEIRATIEAPSLAALEAGVRYQWITELLTDVATKSETSEKNWTDSLDKILTHGIWGTLVFLAITALIFQSIYTWAGPFMDFIEFIFGTVGNTVGEFIPPGALRSLIVDGVVAGVGGVLVFIPQIMLLFFFVAILEDCGYMARAAFLMDKLFSRLGLSGKSFIPLLSSYACAIPGIMATRTIENRRDRFATIMVAPLMSCSARLPVYTIMIAAFVPASMAFGIFNLQGTVLFIMHFVGFAFAIPVIWILKKTILKGATPPFVMELPQYKWPSLKLVCYRVFDRARAFVVRAGTIIFAMTIIVWALSYFPNPNAIEESYLGQMGKIIEPVVEPLGWDWRIGMATVASFPAREVIIATMGTIFHLDGDITENSPSLMHALQTATWPDGRALFSLAVALSLMVFFALCCQCGATIATIKRETNSWGYAWLTFGYMTLLAYVAAFMVYRFALLMGWG